MLYIKCDLLQESAELLEGESYLDMTRRVANQMIQKNIKEEWKNIQLIRELMHGGKMDIEKWHQETKKHTKRQKRLTNWRVVEVEKVRLRGTYKKIETVIAKFSDEEIEDLELDICES